MAHPVFIALFGLTSILSVFTVLWLLSLLLHDVSIVDVAWGMGFLVLAGLYAVGFSSGTPRQGLVLLLVAVWALRLSLYLLGRKWGTPEDYRYRAMRNSHGSRFA